MKADKFNQKEYDELIEALNSTSSTDSITKEENNEIKNFFIENKEMDYNSFLSLYNEKYGEIIKNYREYLKLKTLKIIKIAAILYIITLILGLIGVIYYISN